MELMSCVSRAYRGDEHHALFAEVAQHHVVEEEDRAIAELHLPHELRRDRRSCRQHASLVLHEAQGAHLKLARGQVVVALGKVKSPERLLPVIFQQRQDQLLVLGEDDLLQELGELCHIEPVFRLPVVVVGVSQRFEGGGLVSKSYFAGEGVDVGRLQLGVFLDAAVDEPHVLGRDIVQVLEVGLLHDCADDFPVVTAVPRIEEAEGDALADILLLPADDGR